MHQEPGPGYDLENPDHAAQFHHNRRRHDPETVHATDASGQNAGNVQDPSVQATSAAGGEEIPNPFGDWSRYEFQEVAPSSQEEAASHDQGGMNIAVSEDANSSQAIQQAQSTPDQTGEVHGNREETPGRGPPPPPFNTPEAPSLPRGTDDLGSPTPASHPNGIRPTDATDLSSSTPPDAPRAPLDDSGTSPEVPSQPSSDPSTLTSSSEASEDGPFGIVYMTPDHPHYGGPHPSGYPSISLPPPVSASTAPNVQPTHTSTPPGAAGTSTTTPPGAPGAGDGSRYTGTETSGSPGHRARPASVDRTQSYPAPPAQGAAHEAEDAQSPDFPRASVEREAPGPAEEPQVREEVQESVEQTEQANNGAEATEDSNGKARRKRSGAPSPSPDEDDVDSVKDEPPKKRRKDDKDDGRNDAAGSTTANLPVPQFDGPGDSEDESAALDDEQPSAAQPRNSSSTAAPTDKVQKTGQKKLKRHDLLVYRADRTEDKPMRPTREKVFRNVTPEPDEEMFRGTDREDCMGEGGSKQGKMQGFGTNFDRDRVAPKKHGGKKKDGEGQIGGAGKNGNGGAVDIGNQHDAQSASAVPVRAVPQLMAQVILKT